MPGQPDWQRFQSSSGPILYSATGAAPLASGTLFTGPWRSYFLSATITGGTGVFQIQVDFSSDSANVNKIYTVKSIVGNGKQRIGWQPMVAQYMTITTTLTHATAGDAISIQIAPSLLDAPQATRIVTAPYFAFYEGLLNKNSSVNFDGAYIMPGPATLTVRSNQYSVVYSLSAMDGTGAFNNVQRYQVAQYNQGFQYAVQVPDAPVRLNVFNTESHADATYDIILSPQ